MRPRDIECGQGWQRDSDDEGEDECAEEEDDAWDAEGACGHACSMFVQLFVSSMGRLIGTVRARGGSREARDVQGVTG